MSHLVIRADSSTEIGTGHVMRCLALAQAWQDQGGVAAFVSASCMPAIESRLKKETMDIFFISSEAGSSGDAADTVAIAEKLHADWIVVDGYQFGANYQRDIKKSNKKLLCIDDYGHATRYYADIVLNQNIYATRDLYTNSEQSTRFLLGAGFALIRKEVLTVPRENRSIKRKARKILVTLGGGDPENYTGKILRILHVARIKDCTIKVLVGFCNPHSDILADLVNSAGNQYRLLKNVGDMGKLLHWADIVVTGCGSTTLETAYLGVPMISMAIAENQVLVCKYLERNEAAIVITPQDFTSLKTLPEVIGDLVNNPQKRKILSENSQRLIDGKGAGRVVSTMTEPDFTLREASLGDCEMVFNWANDPLVREQSFSSSPIGWDDHKKWFFSRIGDNKTLFLIILDSEGNPVGQIRYDIEGPTATISISIAKEYRGKHYSTGAINHSAQMLFKITNVDEIRAYVKKDNMQSYHAFINAGFCSHGTTQVKGQSAYNLILKRF
jgi:UDP-2,4-diacetamido-2,4,6-trideoxy-beta-L-altropyranose hydrolase